MQTYEKPDPIFGYELDERSWIALRKEMSAVKNTRDARLGVDAADAFAKAINDPPPTTQAIESLLFAANSNSIAVVRNASCWICTLAALDEHTRQRVRSEWRSLSAKGRWGILWAISPRKPNMESLFTHITHGGLRDRTRNVRCWAATKAQQFRLQECLPVIRHLANCEPDEEARWIFLRSADLLEQGWCFRPDQFDPHSGMMFVSALNEGPTGFSVPSDAFHMLDRASLGRLASMAIQHPDPATFRVFTERFLSRDYRNLGLPAGTQ